MNYEFYFGCKGSEKFINTQIFSKKESAVATLSRNINWNNCELFDHLTLSVELNAVFDDNQLTVLEELCDVLVNGYVVDSRRS